MKKFGYSTIQHVLARCIQEFMDDDSSPDFVSFFYKGHYVESMIEWSISRSCFYVDSFMVVYSNCTMMYLCDVDYDLSDALVDPLNLID